jgi:S-formylglutathione hydrolase FrmB
MGVSTNWIRKVPQLQEMADEHQLIIVCPDGSVNSWYFDSPVDSSYRYETHVGTEVPEYIDANYNTIANRNFRAITGLSMVLWCNVYCIASSTNLQCLWQYEWSFSC